MRVETQIKLNKFKLRNYQYNFARAFESQKYKKFLLVFPRRSGKDFVAFNLILRRALIQKGSYYYCLPTFKQARLVIWESLTMSGSRFLDCIPQELVKRMNSQEMVIELVNGSMIRLIGSDTYNTSLVGTNPICVVFSEFALADDRAYKFVRPILNANQGTVVIISTPRGHNHFYDLYQIAQNSPKEWYCERLTIDDTKHISIEDIYSDIKNGEMSKELAKQEYWSDFSMGIAGSYYGVYMDKMRLENRITEVPYELGHLVHTAWDLGVHNPTTVVFFQVIGSVIHVIDYYQNNSVGYEHYVSILKSKGYIYGNMFAPHDIKVREQSTGVTRLEKASDLGIDFILSVNMSLEDGIEAVRTVLPRCWIDEKNCGTLIKALENYRREFDEQRNVYYEKPVHDQFSDPADAFRYMAININRCGKESSPEDLDKRYHEVMYGTKQDLPPFFRD